MEFGIIAAMQKEAAGLLEKMQDKTETEAAFYAFLLSALTAEEAKTFAALLDTLYVVSKTESRAGFPHLLGGKGK